MKSMILGALAALTLAACGDADVERLRSENAMLEHDVQRLARTSAKLRDKLQQAQDAIDDAHDAIDSARGHLQDLPDDAPGLADARNDLDDASDALDDAGDALDDDGSEAEPVLTRSTPPRRPRPAVPL
jgi:ABC-type transporter Mla subunit MlaD